MPSDTAIQAVSVSRRAGVPTRVLPAATSHDALLTQVLGNRKLEKTEFNWQGPRRAAEQCGEANAANAAREGIHQVAERGESQGGLQQVQGAGGGPCGAPGLRNLHGWSLLQQWPHQSRSASNAEACTWWGKVAEKGDAHAMYALGSCYQYGHGVDKDIGKAEKAKKWSQRRWRSGLPCSRRCRIRFWACVAWGLLSQPSISVHRSHSISHTEAAPRRTTQRPC
jgi:hypothetical protein